MLAAEKTAGDAKQPLLISGRSDIIGSIDSDAIVQRNCFLHVRGSLNGNLTIEQGAQVIVEGSVDGKVINKGGSLVVHNMEIANFVRVTGPPEAEAGGILTINLFAIASNWRALAKSTLAECAAVVKANAYGCSIDQVVAVLAPCGCKTFFVSNLAEARRVRAAARDSIIYVLAGLYAGTGPAFAEVDARPVINSFAEMAEWDVFVAASGWRGGCAMNVDTGSSRHGISMQEAAAFAAPINSTNHGIALLMSYLDNTDRPDHDLHDRQIKVFRELNRLYRGVPASLANSSAMFIGPRTHFDLVRPGAALYGVNPTPGTRNPMLPVIELRARIVQVCKVAPGETICNSGWIANRHMRVAVVSVGYADGYPRAGEGSKRALHVVVEGQMCPLVGRAAMDLLAIDITNLRAPTAVRRGGMVTLIGGEISVDDLAAAAKSTGREVLTQLGQRLRRVYNLS